MLIHLILLLFQLGKSTSGGITTRKRKRGRVVLACPYCRKPGLATEFIVEQRGSEHIFGGWQFSAKSYRCDTCNREYPAGLFHNDGSGVLVEFPPPEPWPASPD